MLLGSVPLPFGFEIRGRQQLSFTSCCRMIQKTNMINKTKMFTPQTTDINRRTGNAATAACSRTGSVAEAAVPGRCCCREKSCCSSSCCCCMRSARRAGNNSECKSNMAAPANAAAREEIIDIHEILCIRIMLSLLTLSGVLAVSSYRSAELGTCCDIAPTSGLSLLNNKWRKKSCSM